jgi:hypothetical protein
MLKAGVDQSQSGKTDIVPEPHDPARIAYELGECRQRGLDWLDRNVKPQRPIRAEALQALAAEYVEARGLLAAGRIAQIKVLLADAIEELAGQGHASDAAMLRELFFGIPGDPTIRSPGELLQSARARTGENESRFRERRTRVMRSFAEFLVTFVTAAYRPVPAVMAVPHASHSLAPVTGNARGSEHFVDLLARAMNVTIIGITNERLVPYLREALNRKRTDGPPDAFWNSLRIVFLGEQLLESISDEREEFHDPKEALRQRRLEATWARRSISVFLKRTNPSRWTLYNWQYLPVLTGSLFEFEDHRKLVHLLIRPPRRPSFDGLYIDIEDNVDEFSAVFEDIVHHSRTDSMIVPVGAPAGEGFKSNEVRLQARVLKDGSGASGWLPMVIVITWRYRNNRAEPILQLRTIENSAREENRISHLGGHILQQDLAQPDGRLLPEAHKTFDSMHESLLSAAKRIVRDATGSDPGDGLQSMATGSYLYPDMEHLYFFVFALELTEATHFPRRAEMHSFRLAELVAIRASQVFTAAAQLCRTADVTPRAFAAAAEVVALNLVLHGHGDLAAKVRELTDQTGYQRAMVAAAISELIVDRTAPSWVPGGQEVLLEGFAGWHYREFFSVLLPLYANLGIAQAAELQAEIEADEIRREARDRLAEIYRDEDLMAVMPLEL